MTGLIMNRYAGYLTVDFCHGNSGDQVDMRFKVYGDTLATTECDESFNIVGQEVEVRQDMTLHCWTTSAASHFFLSMVRWLEAVLCEVHECAFVWEGEGPDGELRWFNGRDGGGRLELKWSGGRSTEPFDHHVALDRRQMIQALYEGFRGFVESDRYDPMSYEDLRYGHVWDLVVAEGKHALVHLVVHCERELAYGVLHAVGDFAHDTDRGPKRQTTLDHFQTLAQVVMARDSEWPEDMLEHKERLIPSSWNQWTPEQRMGHLQDVVSPMKGYGMFGENLRELRSSRIEAWLANPSSLLT